MEMISIREMNQNLSKVMSEVEGGKAYLVTKKGKVIAVLRPAPKDWRQDPETAALRQQIVESFERFPKTGYRVGRITVEDRYGSRGGE